MLAYLLERMIVACIEQNRTHTNKTIISDLKSLVLDEGSPVEVTAPLDVLKLKLQKIVKCHHHKIIINNIKPNP